MAAWRSVLILSAALGLGGAGLAAAQNLLSTYVLLGPRGVATVRAVVDGASCPVVRLRARSLAMSLRAPAGDAPARTAAITAAFPVSVCEASLPHGSRHATIAGRRLPLPNAALRRIVVIGDTGCRVKTSAKGKSVVQPCHDPARYPFARVAAAAARWKPDLVIHVGDYLYRESPCPTDATTCRGDPWGYGWDAWRADFFEPADPLLRVAPLALARGNHETCDRAGQGWRRLLAVGPWTAASSCDDPANDPIGNHTAPYAVPLGRDTQLILFDSSATSGTALTPDDPRAVAFAADYDAIERLSRGRRRNILVNHHPILGFAARTDPDGAVRLDPGNLGLQSVFGRQNAHLLPGRIDLLLSGHVHVWEQLSFDARYPSQFVAGFSGTEEDIVPLPAAPPPSAEPAPGAIVERFASWVDGFGFMTMERTDAARWRVQVRDADGRVVNRCRINGRRSACTTAQVFSAHVSSAPPPAP